MSLKLAMQRRGGVVPPSLPLSLCLVEMGWGVGAAAVHRSRTLPMPPIVAPVRPQPASLLDHSHLAVQRSSDRERPQRMW